MIPQKDASLSNATYFTAWDKGIELTTYAGMFQVTTTKANLSVSKHETNFTGGKRGKVTVLSRKSQKNMQRAFIQKRDYSRPIFITLTVPDEAWVYMRDDTRAIKHALDMLQKRFKRFSSDIAHIWRIEYIERKSGELQGEIAPHYHMVIDGYLDDMGTMRRWLGDSWHEILQHWNPNCRRPRTQALVSKSRRHAMYYLSKYMTKSDRKIEKELRIDEDSICENYHNLDVIQGRHWGKSHNWDTSRGKTIRLSYNQLKELKRRIAAQATSRSPRFAEFLREAPVRQGFSCYYFGDEYCSVESGYGLEELVEIVKRRNPHEFDVVF